MAHQAFKKFGFLPPNHCPAAPVLSQRDAIQSVIVRGEEIERMQAIFNDQPRKILSWHSPEQAFNQLLR